MLIYVLCLDISDLDSMLPCAYVLKNMEGPALIGIFETHIVLVCAMQRQCAVPTLTVKKS